MYKPMNGMKKCSGIKTEDSCHFDCLPGYKLSGSRTRTCGPNKQWTGNSTECKSECMALYFNYNFTYFASVTTVEKVYLCDRL